MHSTLVLCDRSQPFSQDISQALLDCRRQTLNFVRDLGTDVLNTQAHPDFSPIGWHLGHIAYTESLWIIECLAKSLRPFTQWDRLFDAEGLPKAERQHLPELEALLDYLETVRTQTLLHLSKQGAHENRPLWHWLIQHESQHIETMRIVLAMHGLQGKKTSLKLPFFQVNTSEPDHAEMALVKSGEWMQGCDAPQAIDNERPAHAVWVEDYWIDRTPVTCSQYRKFMEAGGYLTEKWWSPAGWQWQQQEKLSAPLYWSQDPALDDSYVCGVSWYEADAYARFVGKRLPTESEWEKAITVDISAGQTVGNVWEWTNTWFDAYPNFQPFPYQGYSQVYFDQAHRVLKSHSWATPPWTHRVSFRNWYHPHRREMFAGFRCAK